MILWKQCFDRRLAIRTIPGFDHIIRKYHDTVLFSYPYEGAKNFFHAGGLRRVNIFDFDVFEEQIDVDFEGHKYRGIKRYHDYLTHCYGDYMQLPPEEERISYHSGVYYWK